MKKLLIVAILMLALVLTVAACKTDPETTETTAGETTVADPVDSTAAPDDTTAAPEETTAAPEETTEATEVTTEEVTTEEVTTEEVTTVDPAEPVLVIDPAFINDQAQSTAGATVNSNIGSSEVITEGAYTFVRLTANGGDPYVAIINLNGNQTLPQFMAISYRTNADTVEGQFFMGSGTGWTGSGDAFKVDWNEDEAWNFMVIDLTAVEGLTSITDGLINYARMDFFTGAGEEGDYIDIEYIAFFNTAEYANAYAFEKHPPYVTPDKAGQTAASFDTFFVNEEMYFEQDGGAGDKLAAQNNTIAFEADATRESMALRGWIGFNQAIDSFGYYIDNYTMIYGEFKQDTEADVIGAGGEHASRFEIDVPLAELEAGVHTVGFVAKLADGTVVRLRDELKVVVVPYLADSTLVLGVRDGGAYAGAGDKKFGQRGQIGTNILTNVTINDLATYSDGNTNTWSFKVWQWNTDYATTVAGTPLFSASGENHQDNQTFSMDIPAACMISGDIYYEIEYLSGSGGFTGWTAKDVVAGIETYVAGQLKDGGYAASITVGMITDGPVAENLVIDLTTVVPNDAAKFEAAWGAAGFTEPVIQMMNYGSAVSLGEIDLSKYSAVIVTYGSDASAKQGDVGTFMALTKNGAVEDAESAAKADAEIIAQATMSNAAGGWTATRTVTIEFESDYVGEVFLAQDMMDGNGIAVTSIVFVGK